MDDLPRAHWDETEFNETFSIWYGHVNYNSITETSPYTFGNFRKIIII